MFDTPSTPRQGLAPVTSLSRKDATMLEIRQAVIEGKLRPGEKLTETSLAESLKVSRATIREALSQLSQEGLLTQEAYKGIRVSSLDNPQIIHLAKTRHALDMLAVAEILEDQSGEKFKKVKEAWKIFEELTISRDPLVRYESHIQFHRAIWEASGNHILLHLWNSIEAHIIIAMAEDEEFHKDPIRAKYMHQKLIDSLETKDLSLIEQEFYKHTIGSAEELVTAKGEKAHG